MENPKPATELCGACNILSESCPSDCFWKRYFKPDDGEKFSLLIKDTTVDALKKKVKKENQNNRQKFIDKLYKGKKREKKSEHEKPEAVLSADSESLNPHEGKAVPDFAFKWGARKRSCTRQQPTTSQLPILAESAEIVEAAGILSEMANGRKA